MSGHRVGAPEPSEGESRRTSSGDAAPFRLVTGVPAQLRAVLANEELLREFRVALWDANRAPLSAPSTSSPTLPSSSSSLSSSPAPSSLSLSSGAVLVREGSFDRPVAGASGSGLLASSSSSSSSSSVLSVSSLLAASGSGSGSTSGSASPAVFCDNVCLQLFTTHVLLANIATNSAHGNMASFLALVPLRSCGVVRLSDDADFASLRARLPKASPFHKALSSATAPLRRALTDAIMLELPAAPAAAATSAALAVVVLRAADDADSALYRTLVDACDSLWLHADAAHHSTRAVITGTVGLPDLLKDENRQLVMQGSLKRWLTDAAIAAQASAASLPASQWSGSLSLSPTRGADAPNGPTPAGWAVRRVFLFTDMLMWCVGTARGERMYFEGAVRLDASCSLVADTSPGDVFGKSKRSSLFSVLRKPVEAQAFALTSSDLGKLDLPQVWLVDDLVQRRVWMHALSAVLRSFGNLKVSKLLGLTQRSWATRHGVATLPSSAASQFATPALLLSNSAVIEDARDEQMSLASSDRSNSESLSSNFGDAPAMPPTLATQPSMSKIVQFFGQAPNKGNRRSIDAGADAFVGFSELEVMHELVVEARESLAAGNVLQALKQYGKALKVLPRDAHVLSERGMALLRLGRISEAESSFAAALAVDAGHLTVRYYLWRCGAVADPAAVTLANLAAVIDASDVPPALLSEALYQRAQWHLRQSSAEAARFDITGALLIESARPELLLTRAVCHLMLADPHTATVDLDAALASIVLRLVADEDSASTSNSEAGDGSAGKQRRRRKKTAKAQRELSGGLSEAAVLRASMAAVSASASASASASLSLTSASRASTPDALSVSPAAVDASAYDIAPRVTSESLPPFALADLGAEKPDDGSCDVLALMFAETDSFGWIVFAYDANEVVPPPPDAPAQRAAMLRRAFLWVCYFRSLALRQLGRFTDALKACDEALRVAPRESVATTRLLVSRAATMMRQSLLAPALALLKELSPRRPNDRTLFHVLGLCAFGTGAFQDAVHAFSTALQDQDDAPSGAALTLEKVADFNHGATLLARCRAFMSLQRYLKAAEDATAALAQADASHTKAQALTLRAQANVMQAERTDDVAVARLALSDCNSALNERPDDATTLFTRARTLVFLEDENAAMRDLLLAVSLSSLATSNVPASLAAMRRADELRARGAHPAAVVGAYDVALSHDATLAEAYYRRARVVWNARRAVNTDKDIGKIARAVISDLNHCIKLSPSFSPAFVVRSDARRELRDTDGANADASAAENLAANDAEVARTQLNAMVDALQQLRASRRRSLVHERQVLLAPLTARDLSNAMERDGSDDTSRSESRSSTLRLERHSSSRRQRLVSRYSVNSSTDSVSETYALAPAPADFTTLSDYVPLPTFFEASTNDLDMSAYGIAPPERDSENGSASSLKRVGFDIVRPIAASDAASTPRRRKVKRRDSRVAAPAAAKTAAVAAVIVAASAAVAAAPADEAVFVDVADDDDDASSSSSTISSSSSSGGGGGDNSGGGGGDDDQNYREEAPSSATAFKSYSREKSERRGHVSAKPTSLSTSTELSTSDEQHVVRTVPGEKAAIVTVLDRELRFVERIGTGQYGVVWRAVWRKHGKVAVKQLRTTNKMASTQLIREAARCASLPRHENVVALLALCHNPLSIVFELCVCSLREFLVKCDAFSLDDLAALVRDAAAGLSHLHSRRIVHRDIAARNVLLAFGSGERLRAKLGDFGLARAVGTFDESRHDSLMPLKWMAPERLLRIKDGVKGDVYSFGVLIFELVTRQQPWSNLTKEEAAQAVMQGRTLKLPPFAPRLAHDIANSCWLKVADERPSIATIHEKVSGDWLAADLAAVEPLAGAGAGALRVFVAPLIELAVCRKVVDVPVAADTSVADVLLTCLEIREEEAMAHLRKTFDTGTLADCRLVVRSAASFAELGAVRAESGAKVSQFVDGVRKACGDVAVHCTVEMASQVQRKSQLAQ
jgi:tetratricopeptide (TPR) repeat protein